MYIDDGSIDEIVVHRNHMDQTKFEMKFRTLLASIRIRSQHFVYAHSVELTKTKVIGIRDRREFVAFVFPSAI